MCPVSPQPPKSEEEIERLRRWEAIDYEAVIVRQIAEDEALVQLDEEQDR